MTASPLQRLQTRLSLVALALGAALPLQATELSPQERLEAVRQELIQAALQGATQVRSTAWLDDSGALRESSSFRHGMQVRGVRVLAYQRDDSGQPRAQVQLQGREDLLKPSSQAAPAVASAPAAKPAAASPPAACTPDRRLRHVLGWSLAVDSRAPAAEAHLLHAAGEALARHWLEAGASPQAWRLVEAALPADTRVPLPGTSAAYQQLLTAGPAPLVPGWVARLRLEPAPRGPASAWPVDDQGLPQMGVRLSLTVAATEGAAALFESRADLALPVEARAWSPPRLSATAAPRLAALVGAWVRALDERLSCQPVKVQVLQARGDRLEVDQGSLAGMKAGEEWLVSDRQKVPQHMIEPGAADSLVLARVETVGPQRAELKVLAGAPGQVRPRWQAWPLQSP